MTAQDATKAHKNAKARRERKNSDDAPAGEEVKVHRGGGSVAPAKPKGSPVERLRNYFKGIYAESKRVSWPGKKEVYGGTMVTLIILVIFSAYLGTLDYVLNRVTTGLGL